MRRLAFARRTHRLRVGAVLSLALGLACLTPAGAFADTNRAGGGAAPAATGGTSFQPGGAAPGPAGLAPGERARLLSDGTAQAPASAPDVVKRVIAAGNQIAHLPYRDGGGHGTWTDTGYDCSGSVSYALHGAGLLRESADATGFYRYGLAGPGRWITTYANGSHMYMVVAGLRFDTTGRAQTGSRWQTQMRSPATFIVRHPAGL